jgi:hypothetical protein
VSGNLQPALDRKSMRNPSLPGRIVAIAPQFSSEIGPLKAGIRARPIEPFPQMLENREILYQYLIFRGESGSGRQGATFIPRDALSLRVLEIWPIASVYALRLIRRVGNGAK